MRERDLFHRKSLFKESLLSTIRARMNGWVTKKLMVLGCLAASTTGLFGAEGSGEPVAVPEPSAVLIGGLCGIIFLLWRRK